MLILDEPSNGLDPEGIVQIRELLTDLASNHGVTIFISSHILGEISKFASRIGIIHEGHMIRETETDHLYKSRHRALHVSSLDNQKAYEILLKNHYSPIHLPDDSLELPSESAINNPEHVSSLLATNSVPPTKIVLFEEDLESYFLRIIHTNAKES